MTKLAACVGAVCLLAGSADATAQQNLAPAVFGDKLFLATSRPPFGGLRWWFVCPRENRRVRKLHLALGGRHFWSRRAYELAYASQLS